MKKTCIDCKESLDVNDFYRLRKFCRLRKGEEYRQSRCKVCDNVKRLGLKAERTDRRRVDAIRRPDGSIVLVRR